MGIGQRLLLMGRVTPFSPSFIRCQFITDYRIHREKSFLVSDRRKKATVLTVLLPQQSVPKATVSFTRAQSVRD